MKTKWNHDGTSLMTSGEDGQLKIWSRSGMLRSTHAQTESPIYAAVWSPFSSGVLYSSGKTLTIQPFGSNSKVFICLATHFLFLLLLLSSLFIYPRKKTIQWLAHDSVVLSVAWCSVSNLIASGGEDCHLKIWDSLGQQLFKSTARLHPITEIRWSPDGSLCAFATFSSACVCSCYGVSRSIYLLNIDYFNHLLIIFI